MRVHGFNGFNVRNNSFTTTKKFVSFTNICHLSPLSRKVFRYGNFKNIGQLNANINFLYNFFVNFSVQKCLVMSCENTPESRIIIFFLKVGLSSKYFMSFTFEEWTKNRNTKRLRLGEMRFKVFIVHLREDEPTKHELNGTCWICVCVA